MGFDFREISRAPGTIPIKLVKKITDSILNLKKNIRVGEQKKQSFIV